MQSFTILPFLALLLLTVMAEDGHGQQVHHTRFPIQGRCNNPLLFVFGASMVDTGQYTAVLPYSTAADFPPYGLNYFSRPAGRWSNGRIITDFISKPLLDFQFLHSFNPKKLPLTNWSHFVFKMLPNIVNPSQKNFPSLDPNSSAESICIGLPPRNNNAFVQLLLFLSNHRAKFCYFRLIIVIN